MEIAVILMFAAESPVLQAQMVSVSSVYRTARIIAASRQTTEVVPLKPTVKAGCGNEDVPRNSNQGAVGISGYDR
jgi:hypothetical protein